MQTPSASLKNWLLVNLMMMKNHILSSTRSILHQVSLITLSCFDDKVYIKDPVKWSTLSSHEDEGVVQTFIDKLVQDITWICRNCSWKKMTITPKQQRKFQKVTKCWICREELIKDESHQEYEKKQPVRDHCHFTGKYRGPACNECNRQFRKPKSTPIFFP